MTKTTARARRAKTASAHPKVTQTSPKPTVAIPSAPDRYIDYSAIPLFLWFPPDDDHTFLSGVLRRTYKTHVNTVTGFVRSKLHPIGGSEDEADWRPTAERAELVLPPAASDTDRDIRAFAERFDRELLPHKQSLLVYVTLRFPTHASLQRGWEMGRAFALRNFALKRRLPTLVVQHAPHKMGSANPPHLHLLVFPRALASLGLGVFDDAITTDAGLETIYAEWLTFSRRWG